MLGGSILEGLPGDPTQTSPQGKAFGQSIDLSRVGDAAARKGDWKGAQQSYQKALTLSPGDPMALRGMAKAARAAGDTQAELRYYRAAIYSYPNSHYISEPYPENLMGYVLALVRNGQEAEAVYVYDHGATELDVADGHPLVRVAVPMYAQGPGVAPPAPQELEAMAHLVRAIGNFSHEAHTDPKVGDDFREAVRLAPDSASANYHLGKYLYGYDDAGAKAALEKAVQLGDTKTVAAAKDILQFLH